MTSHAEPYLHLASRNAWATAPRPVPPAAHRFPGQRDPWVRQATEGTGTGAPGAGSQISIEDLLADAEEAPARRPVVAHVLRLADDPATDAGGLADAVSREPQMAAHVMRTANSAFFGLSGKVTNLRFAVTVLGFSTVQGLAAAALIGAVDGDTPDGMWPMSVAHAVGAGLLAPRLGAPGPEAFCAGLLAGLGRSVLHQADAAGYDTNVTACTPHPDDIARLEKSWCGWNHAEVGERVFAAWHFPEDLVAAIAHQHRPTDTNSPALTTTIRAAHEVAARACGHDARNDLAHLTRGRVTEAEASSIIEYVSVQADALRAAILGPEA